MRTPADRSQEAEERIGGAIAVLQVIAEYDMMTEDARETTRRAIGEVRRSLREVLELAWPCVSATGEAEATGIALAIPDEPAAKIVAHKVVRRPGSRSKRRVPASRTTRREDHQ